MVAVVGLFVVAVVEEAASIERTAAAISQRAERMRERSWDVKALEASFTKLIVDSNSSTAGAAATATDHIAFSSQDFDSKSKFSSKLIIFTFFLHKINK